MAVSACRAAAVVLLAGLLITPTYAATDIDEDTVPEKNFTVEISKGKLVHLTSAASAVIAADPAVADVQVVSPTLVYINGKAVGETTVFAVDSHDHEILRAVVTVTHNISKLNEAVKAMVPDSKVNFQSIDGALVMNGEVDSPLQAEDIRRLATPFLKSGQTLVNMLKPTGSNQVMLKVKIVEVDRSEMKTFGFNLENLLNFGSFQLAFQQGRTFLSSTTGTGYSFNGTQDTLLQATGASTLTAGYQSGSKFLNGAIDALEDDGLVTTLAEPTLTTQSGQPASFLAGGEIPVPSVTGSGSTAQISVTYQPFGVSLNFTPVVLSKDRISMLVAPEVSSLTTNGEIQDAGFTIPALQDRKASTTVELGSGQSFAIAGLLQNDHNNDIQKFPFLGDIPVLGALFRSTSFQHNQTELVIIVTPYIVNAVDSRKAMRDPVQGLEMASDAERILMGKLYKEKPAGKASSDDTDDLDRPRLRGPVPWFCILCRAACACRMQRRHLAAVIRAQGSACGAGNADARRCFCRRCDVAESARALRACGFHARRSARVRFRRDACGG
jgi:pilus assembly protein CpaC